MTKPPRVSPLHKQHAALWYGSSAYRLAWVILPQALMAALFAIFALGAGMPGVGLGGGAVPSDWGKPVKDEATVQDLLALRDGVGDNSAPEGLAVIEQLADSGNTVAMVMLGALYDPMYVGALPYPTEKDPARAIALFEKAIAAGDKEAFSSLAELVLQPDTPYYDVAKACTALEGHVKAPEFDLAAVDAEKGDDWVLLNAADCMSGVLRPEGADFPTLDAEGIKTVLSFYNHPILAPFNDRNKGIASFYLDPASPVYDLKKGCDAARAWGTGLNDAAPWLRPNDQWILVQTFYCMLGTDDRRTEAKYQPKIEDETIIGQIVELPALENTAQITKFAAWLYLNPDHNLVNAVNGCAKVNKWIGQIEPGPDQFDTLSVWNAAVFGDCLLSRDPDIPRFEPTADQKRIGIELLQNAAKRSHANAQLTLGEIYDFGYYDQPEDDDRALSYYQQCAATSEPNCIKAIGQFKQFGHGGFAVNLDAAAVEYEKCAKLGLAFCDAAFVSVRMTQDKPTLNDDTETFNHLKAAVDRNEGYGFTLYAIAVYQGNFGLRSDDALAAQWFVKAFATAGGATEVQRFERFNAPLIKSSAFWKAFHRELKSRGVYDGPISSKLTTKTMPAAAKLAP